MQKKKKKKNPFNLLPVEGSSETGLSKQLSNQVSQSP